MIGRAFELHVQREHAELLDDQNYLFGLTGTQTGSSERSSLAYDTLTIKFNAENPWQDILSSSSRQIRSIDAVSVDNVIRANGTELYSYLGKVHYKDLSKLSSH